MNCSICGKKVSGSAYQWGDGYSREDDINEIWYLEHKQAICDTCGNVVEAFIEFLRAKAMPGEGGGD